MRDVLESVRRWYAEGMPVGLATVIGVRKSAPRQPGASMAVTPEGEVAGSVSGGCVEGAVFQESQEVLATGRPKRLTYGISDDEAFSVGLTCGGEIDLFVEVLDRHRMPSFEALTASIEAEESVAVATVIDAGNTNVEVGAKLVVWPDRARRDLGSAVGDDPAHPGIARQPSGCVSGDRAEPAGSPCPLLAGGQAVGGHGVGVVVHRGPQPGSIDLACGVGDQLVQPRQRLAG